MEQQNSKKDKLTDKAFTRFLVISILGIVICIICLCSTTYAWFVSEQSISNNSLTAGSFDVTVTVQKDGEDITVSPDPAASGVMICELPHEGVYTVNMKPVAGKSTVRGHCVVTVGNDGMKHTDAIISETVSAGNRALVTDPFTFTLTVTEATTVRFEPRWGVVIEPDIENGGSYPTPEAITE